MIEFKRNEKTGEIEAWKNGKKIGEVMTMGGKLNAKDRNNRSNK